MSAWDIAPLIKKDVHSSRNLHGTPMLKEACTLFISPVVWALQQKLEVHNYQPDSEIDLFSPLLMTQGFKF